MALYPTTSVLIRHRRRDTDIGGGYVTTEVETRGDAATSRGTGSHELKEARKEPPPPVSGRSETPAAPGF